MQLRSFSKETTQEANIIHAKQIQSDRQIADMSLTISKLEAKLREYDKLSLNNDSNAPTSSFNDDENPNQIKILSEEVLRLRDKLANQNSVSLSMKNRLKVAVDRSNNLEDQLMVAKTSSNNGDGDAFHRAQESCSNTVPSNMVPRTGISFSRSGAVS